MTRKGLHFLCSTWQHPPETTSPETWRGSDLGNTKKERILVFFQCHQVKRDFSEVLERPHINCWTAVGGVPYGKERALPKVPLKTFKM